MYLCVFFKLFLCVFSSPTSSITTLSKRFSFVFLCFFLYFYNCFFCVFSSLTSSITNLSRRFSFVFICFYHHPPLESMDFFKPRKETKFNTWIGRIAIQSNIEPNALHQLRPIIMSDKIKIPSCHGMLWFLEISN